MRKGVKNKKSAVARGIKPKNKTMKLFKSSKTMRIAKKILDTI
jgi:hypothetical protein